MWHNFFSHAHTHTHTHTHFTISRSRSGNSLHDVTHSWIAHETFTRLEILGVFYWYYDGANIAVLRSRQNSNTVKGYSRDVWNNSLKLKHTNRTPPRGSRSQFDDHSDRRPTAAEYLPRDFTNRNAYVPRRIRPKTAWRGRGDSFFFFVLQRRGENNYREPYRLGALGVLVSYGICMGAYIFPRIRTTMTTSRNEEKSVRGPRSKPKKNYRVAMSSSQYVIR